MNNLKIVINAGHTKFGTGTGAVGKLNESQETRKIAFEIMKKLVDTEHEVLPAVFDKDDHNLRSAVQVANENKADLFLSIHLNAGGGHGCEAYTWKGKPTNEAVKALKNLATLGFTNRGVKDGSSLYVIRNTNCPSVLLEICFVDNDHDFALFKKTGYERIATAIVEALK